MSHNFVVTSLTIPRPTNAAGMPVDRAQEMTQEQFFLFLEQEMRKIEQFTQKQVQEIRRKLNEVERSITFSNFTGRSVETEAFHQQVEQAAEDFLK